MCHSRTRLTCMRSPFESGPSPLDETREFIFFLRSRAMRNQTESGVSLTKVEFIFFIVSCLLAVAGCSSGTPNGVTDRSEPAKTSPAPAHDFEKQHQQAEAQLRPGIEAEREKDQKEAEQALDQDAIAAIEQTDSAIKAIAANNKNDAMGAIEAATGKINSLLARNPASALIPVHVDVG